MNFKVPILLRSNRSVVEQNSLFNFGILQTRIKQYGANDAGALRWDTPAAENHATKYYDFCRKRKSDCAVIANNTGFREQDIQRIKNHVFFNSHELYDGEIGRFDPSYDMAQSWQRLSENRGFRIEDNDITLLNHEFLESVIEQTEHLPYAEAHKKADAVYHYITEKEKGEIGYDSMVHRTARNRR